MPSTAFPRYVLEAPGIVFFALLLIIVFGEYSGSLFLLVICWPPNVYFPLYNKSMDGSFG